MPSVTKWKPNTETDKQNTKWRRYKQGSSHQRDCDTEFKKRKCSHTRWRNSRWWFVPLMILNFTGRAGAVEAASHVIASLLGYPTYCTVDTEIRPCVFTLSCWMGGGSRVRGCGGGWLFSCCVPARRGEEQNSIPSSDWKYKEYKMADYKMADYKMADYKMADYKMADYKMADYKTSDYKMAPPKPHKVPMRSVMPNNVFRRRVDDDVSQMDCGLPSTRILQKHIIGGREARFAEFPWQAHVRISEFQCGGVLVSRWYVATAAHCVSRARPRDIAVWLGALDTTAGADTARKVGVIQKIPHPLFQFRMTQPDRYDIALLKLARPITYTSHILPICLPDHDLDLRGKAGVIAGWGKTDTSNGHTGTNLLRSATVPILSTEQCIKWHQIKQISVEIHSEMICAGHSDGHQDACLGDSGGPLIVLDGGRYYLAGITSAGFGCGVDHQPGIYHNVKLTAPWIRALIARHNYKYIDY